MIDISLLFEEKDMRVYTAIEFARVMLATMKKDPVGYKKVKIGKEVIDVPIPKPVTIRGSDFDDVAYMWTALMLLGPSSGMIFDRSTIRVVSSSNPPFNPEKQFKLFTFGKSLPFNASSIYTTVFKTYLGDFIPTCDPDEADQLFGREAPEEIRSNVSFSVYLNLIKSYFVEKDNTLSLKTGTNAHEAFKEFGPKKLRAFDPRIMAGITHVDFSSNAFEYMDSDCIAALLSAAKWATRVDLSYSDLNKLKGSYKTHAENLGHVLGNIAPSVSFVNLAGNELGGLDVKSLIASLDNLGPHVTGISLGKNELHRLGMRGLIQLFSSLPSNIEYLDLQDNDFSSFTGEALRDIFRAIPKTVTRLNISGTSLQKIEFSKPKEQRFHSMATAFSGFHAELTTLHMENMCLEPGTGSVLTAFSQIFKNLPRGLKQLYLANKARPDLFLDGASNEVLAEAMKYVPEEATSPDTNLIQRLRRMSISPTGPVIRAVARASAVGHFAQTTVQPSAPPEELPSYEDALRDMASRPQ